MRVFLTGGTGNIGTAVLDDLLASGHTVLALTRSEESARAVEAVGAQALRGGLSDLDVLRRGAAECDGVISLAFGRGVGSPEALAKAVVEEGAALGALGDELRGSDRPIVAFAGTPWLPGRVATEADPLSTDGPVGGRTRSLAELLDLAARGVRSTVVRVPRTVHDRGEGGFAGVLTDRARRTRVSGYPGDGTQRWPAVHTRDAAVLFRLALEKAAAGTSWHAVADEGDAVRDIAAVIGRRLGLPVQPVPQQDFGPLGAIFSTDGPASSAHTRDALGWRPTQPSLLDDLENITP